MPSAPLSLFLSLLLLPLALAAVTPSLALPPPPPLHLNPYTNPSTSSDCNLDCRRVFCTSVSQFLESVTCTQHRPCLSLNLQFKIQEKCLNWRPEIHHPAAKPDSSPVDPDCVGPQWVKAYVPADIGYEWLRKGRASRTRVRGEQTDGVCVGALRWVCLLAVVAALFCAWRVKERRALVDRRVKGKEELA